MALPQIDPGAAPNNGLGTTLRAGAAIINAIITQMWDTVTGGIAYNGGNASIGDDTAPGSLLTLSDVSGASSVQIGMHGKRTADGNLGQILFSNNTDSVAAIAVDRIDEDNSAEMNISTQNMGSIGVRMKIDKTGNVFFPETYNNTTASAGNMFIDSLGKHFRSTSSEELKNILEPISTEYSGNIYRIAKETAIFYKSLCKGDNPKWTWYGLSAEKLYKIDPRLVHLGYWPEDYETLTKNIEVDEFIKSKNPFVKDKIIKITKQVQYKALKENAELSPVGVQETKIIPLMLVEMDRMNDKINDLEQRLLALESK